SEAPERFAHDGARHLEALGQFLLGRQPGVGLEVSSTNLIEDIVVKNVAQFRPAGPDHQFLLILQTKVRSVKFLGHGPATKSRFNEQVLRQSSCKSFFYNRQNMIGNRE